MKICQITRWCHSHGGMVGGLQRYVLDLVRCLDSMGYENTIACLGAHDETEAFVSQGVRILPVGKAGPFPTEQAVTERLTRKILDEENPDLLHFHSFSLPETAIARAAVERGTPCVFTYHGSPNNCFKRTLKKRDGSPCDGEVRPMRCSACLVQSRLGLPLPVCYIGSLVSAAFSSAFGPRYRGELMRKLCVAGRLRRWRKGFREFLGCCSLAVSVCDWGVPVLIANGLSPEKARHFPLGVPLDFAEAMQRRLDEPHDRQQDLFVVGFVGRTVPEKGTHILLEAFRRTSYDNARLRIRGWNPGMSDAKYLRRLRRAARGDARIEILPVVPLDKVIEEYSRLSLVAIPSEWMEAGPTVLQEAVALGIPVFGSSNIGHLKLLEEMGTVVHPNTPEAWQQALESAFALHKEGRFNKTASPAGALRTMRDVALEMAKEYERLLGGGRRA